MSFFNVIYVCSALVFLSATGMASKSNIETLQEEHLGQIFVMTYRSEMNPYHLVNTRLVCSKWHKMIEQEKFWENLLIQFYLPESGVAEDKELTIAVSLRDLEKQFFIKKQLCKRYIFSKYIGDKMSTETDLGLLTKHLLKQADLGLEDSIYELGGLYELTPLEQSDGLAILSKYAYQKSEKASELLINAYARDGSSYGLDVSESSTQAEGLRITSELANLGVTVAKKQFIMAYAAGYFGIAKDAPQSINQAKELLEKELVAKSDAGILAMYEIYILGLLDIGDDFQQNIKNLFVKLKSFAEHNEVAVECMLQVFNEHTYNLCPEKKDYNEYVDFLENLASKGSLNARLELKKKQKIQI